MFRNITLINAGFVKFEGQKNKDSFFKSENNFHEQINIKVGLQYHFLELTEGFSCQYFNNTVISSILGTHFN